MSMNLKDKQEVLDALHAQSEQGAVFVGAGEALRVFFPHQEWPLCMWPEEFVSMALSEVTGMPPEMCNPNSITWSAEEHESMKAKLHEALAKNADVPYIQMQDMMHQPWGEESVRAVAEEAIGAIDEARRRGLRGSEILPRVTLGALLWATNQDVPQDPDELVALARQTLLGAPVAVPMAQPRKVRRLDDDEGGLF